MTKPKPTHIALELDFARKVRAILGQMPADQILPVLQEWEKQPAVTLRLDGEPEDPAPDSKPIAPVPDIAGGDSGT